MVDWWRTLHPSSHGGVVARLKAKLNREILTWEHKSQSKVKRSCFKTVVIPCILIGFHKKKNVVAASRFVDNLDLTEWDLVQDASVMLLALDSTEKSGIFSLLLSYIYSDIWYTRIDGEQHTCRVVVKPQKSPFSIHGKWNGTFKWGEGTDMQLWFGCIRMAAD